jgi:hypothetical protein
MGDKSLMKKIFLLLLLTLPVLVNADLSVEQIQKMVMKIHEKREGVKLVTLETTKDPFIKLSEENNVTTLVIPENEDAKLALHAIVNGKAYINDSWSSIGDTIMGYTVKYIGQRGVVLRNGNHVKKLFLHEERDNFIKLEERL